MSPGPARASDDRLAGRRIAVTGAAAGIGRALADALLACGATVAMVDRDPAVSDAAAGAQGRALGIVADLCAPGQPDRALGEAWAALGGLDALVNVAGIYPVTPALEMDEEEWDRVLDLNLKAPFLCSRAFAARAIGAGQGGRILNLSSSAATQVRPGIAHYAASKAGLNQLTRALAIEWAPHGILVNAVAPGVIETERVLAHNQSARGREEAMTKLARVPLGRFGTPEEVVEICLFLLGGADYCTGSVFGVDGGYGLGIPRYG
jgi:NAD(P)-dependent dehydrogenase (short-subunit alcohol dehydrogenase family)